MSALKIVLDTNIFLVILGTKSPYRWIFDKILAGEFILCVSTAIVFEYTEILAKKTTQEIANNIKVFLTNHPHVKSTDIYYNFNLITEDEDDNKFVDCVIASNAIFLVSNDRHFQVLKKIEFPVVNVLSLNEFTKMVAG
jgi:uncharacterized protein